MSAPALLLPFPVGMRFVQVPGDNLEPELCSRDFVLMDPVDRYTGEAIYLLRDGLGGLAIYRCHTVGTPRAPRIALGSTNHFYGPLSLSLARFNELVVGKVAMTCKVHDARLTVSPAIAA